jgi:hypothetical protein
MVREWRHPRRGMVGRPNMPYDLLRVADDDTRYRIVNQRRRTPTREGADAGAGERRARAKRNTAPAIPAAIASGTSPAAQRVKRAAVDQPEEISAVMMPRIFGGTEIVVEDHGDHIAIVFPGAIRLVGTRDEAVALAAALLHSIENKR